MNIVALACCRNRRELTIASLGDLYKADLPERTYVSFVLVDDSSSDDTVASVSSRFPDVSIIHGSGNLYWAGAMRYGWEQAVYNQQLDYLFVFNDDVRFYANVLQELIDVAMNSSDPDQPLAVVGSVIDPCTGKTSYGGRCRSSQWHPLKFAQLIEPNGVVQQADVFNMNAALISRSALDRVGFLAPYFVHSGADFEFGLRLRKSGGVILVAPGVVGTCKPNPITDARQPLLGSISERLRYLLDPKREPPKQRWEMYRHHGGPFWFLLFLIPYISIWFPRWHNR